MSKRKVAPADPNSGEAGFTVEGLPYTYEEETANRLANMNDDGTFASDEGAPAPAPAEGAAGK